MYVFSIFLELVWTFGIILSPGEWWFASPKIPCAVVHRAFVQCTREAKALGGTIRRKRIWHVG